VAAIVKLGVFQLTDKIGTCIFLDESGKPEVYSAKGTNLVEAGTATKHLVLAAVKTSDQLDLQRKITAFRSVLLNDEGLKGSFSAAYALDAFHAKNDYPEVRTRFYNFIASLKGVEVHVIVTEKLRCMSSLKRNPVTLYGVMSGLILQGICHQDIECEVIFSRQDNGKKVKDELELEVERICEQYWNQRNKKIQLKYQHNPHYSHGGLQVADYAAYAVFQYYEKGNAEYLSLIKSKIRYLYHYNNKGRFTRSRPLELS